jgi:hypothetical protein
MKQYKVNVAFNKESAEILANSPNGWKELNRLAEEGTDEIEVHIDSVAFDTLEEAKAYAKGIEQAQGWYMPAYEIMQPSNPSPNEIALIAAILGDNFSKVIYDAENEMGYIATIEQLALWAQEFYDKYKDTDWEAWSLSAPGYPTGICWDQFVIEWGEKKVQELLNPPVPAPTVRLPTLVLTEDEFWEQYKPNQNTIGTHGSFEGCMFETYGEELEQVKKVLAAEPDHIFTIIEVDGEMYISKGFHYVNRFGYLITENPMTENMEDIHIDTKVDDEQDPPYDPEIGHSDYLADSDQLKSFDEPQG